MRAPALRADTASQGGSYTALLAPLLRPTLDDLRDGLALFEAHEALGAFDAVLAATALWHGAEALAAADPAFAAVPGLTAIHPGSPTLTELISSLDALTAAMGVSSSNVRPTDPRRRGRRSARSPSRCG